MQLPSGSQNSVPQLLTTPRVIAPASQCLSSSAQRTGTFSETLSKPKTFIFSSGPCLSFPPCPILLSPAPPAPRNCSAAASRQGCCPVVPVRKQLPTSSGCCGSFDGYQPPVLLFRLHCSCQRSCSVHGPWSSAFQPLISASATCRDRRRSLRIHRWGCLRSTCFPKASPCHSPGSCGSRSSSSSFVAIKATAYTATFLSWCASQPLSLQLLFLLLPLLFLYLTNSAVQTKNQDLERSCVLGLRNLGITFVSEAREVALYLGFCSNGTWVCALPTCLLSAPLGHNWKTASSRMFQRCFWFPLSLCKHASPQ